MDINNTALTVGTKVRCNGYEGTVTKLCDGQLNGMIEVRLDAGLVCIDAKQAVRA